MSPLLTPPSPSAQHNHDRNDRHRSTQLTRDQPPGPPLSCHALPCHAIPSKHTNSNEGAFAFKPTIYCGEVSTSNSTTERSLFFLSLSLPRSLHVSRRRVASRQRLSHRATTTNVETGEKATRVDLRPPFLAQDTNNAGSMAFYFKNFLLLGGVKRALSPSPPPPPPLQPPPPRLLPPPLPTALPGFLR